MADGEELQNEQKENMDQTNVLVLIMKTQTPGKLFREQKTEFIGIL